MSNYFGGEMYNKLNEIKNTSLYKCQERKKWADIVQQDIRERMYKRDGL